MDPSNENQVSLLTIPRSDLDSSSAKGNAVLLQLPPGWKPNDLKEARFVAGTADQQAALVVESKRCSFSCFTVETSNALIMVPPTNTEEHHSSSSSSSNKRSKVLEHGKTLTTVPARLLKTGGSGASFLELRPKTLRRSDLRIALQKCGVWDPYNNNSNIDDADKKKKGRTVSDLAGALQVSTAQIVQGLCQIPNALRLPRRSSSSKDDSGDADEYVLISEEPLQECYAAIVAALAEVDECQDYAASSSSSSTGGISVDAFVEEVLYRMSGEERFPDADHVIYHCLRQLQASSSRSSSLHSSNKKKDRPITTTTMTTTTPSLRLDVTQVAVCVVRRLFRTKHAVAAWVDEETLFAQWQSELPGVGKLYQVQPQMLLGVAVVKEDEEERDDQQQPGGGGRFWRYLPADSLSEDPKTCFDQLFDVKERWLLHEMEPYLEQRLTEDATAAELLLRFTQIEIEERDGLTTKWYLKK